MKLTLILISVLLAGCSGHKIVPAHEYTKSVDSGFMRNCKAVEGSQYAVQCEPAYTDELQVECPNKTDVMLTAQDGKHWCLKVKP